LKRVKAVAARMEGDLEGDGGIELTGQIFRIPLSEVQFTEMREGTQAERWANQQSVLPQGAARGHTAIPFQVNLCG